MSFVRRGCDLCMYCFVHC